VRKLMIRLLFFLFAVGIFLTGSGLGQDYALVEDLGKGTIDWANGLIHVVGYGAPPQGVFGPQAKLMARSAAKADAYRNTAEVLNGVRVSSQTYVENYVTRSDEIKLIVEGFVRGARIIRVDQHCDGIIELTIELPLGGQTGLTTLLNRPEVTGGSVTGQAIPFGERWPEVATERTVYTGVLIDARKLNVKPALYPQIFDYEGYLLYASTLVDMARPGFTTIVAYARSLDLARKLPRLGDNPLVLTADGAVPTGDGDQTDIILGIDAAKAFRELPPAVIQSGAVVFVID
jgi:hypothetical protein